MKTKWKSIAKWDKKDVSTGTSENESEDTHLTEEMAVNVIRALKMDGLGGGREIFPIDVRIEKVVE